MLAANQSRSLFARGSVRDENSSEANEAQVAAFATNHLSVVKASDGTVTASDVRRLEGAEREAEMARLLSGMPDSDAALTHARELLGLRAEAD